MSAIAAAQAAALISRLREEARRRSDELRLSARNQCRETEREARHEARARLHAAVAEKRRRVAERCRAVEIEQQELLRSRDFERAAQLVAQALAALPDALATRWQNPDTRRAWCSHAIEAASRVLTGREWNIEISSAVGARERNQLESDIAAFGARVVRWRDDLPAIGLRIGQDTTWIDGTAERLLRDRNDLAARFLAEFEARGPGR
jgi:hypothetical protein